MASRSALPLTTPWKLWLGFGALIALLVLSLVLIASRLSSINDGISQTVDVRQRIDATRDLDLALALYALSVEERLLGRQSSEVDPGGVDEAFGLYQSVESSEEHSRLSTTFAAQWAEMQRLGREVLVAGDGPPTASDVEAFGAARANLRRLVREEMIPDALAILEARRVAVRSDLRGVFLFTLLVLAAGAVLATITSAVVGRAVMRDQRFIAEQAERLRTTLASIGDAVIATDRDNHITTMNAVAESLTGWSNEQAAGRPLSEVFQIVNEITREPVDDPAEEALREGKIVSLSNHTVLIAKDGSERAIEDSAAPIRCKVGEIVGCVLVFRDVTDRRKASVALRRSEHELAEFFENASVAILWLGPDGSILRANEKALELAGCPREEYLGRSIRDFHLDPESMDEVLAKLRNGETLRELPARLRRKDGSIRDVLLDCNALFEDGRFVHARCFTRDVTELKLALHAQASLAAIVASSDDAIVSKSLDGVIQSWNAAAERIFGYTAEEAVGREITFVIPPERKMEEVQILQRLRAGERVESFESVRMRKDGSLVPVSLTISPLRDETGRVVGASKIARDITARLQAENTLRESEERFRALSENVPAIVWAWNPDGELTYVNSAWTDCTGQSMEDSLGFGWSKTIHPDDKVRALTQWRHCVETGEVYECELRYSSRGGGYCWHYCRAKPVRGDDGAISVWHGASLDIQEKKSAEEALREADRRKDEFLATLSHELRNPLAPISMGLQALKLCVQDPEKIEATLTMMERQTRQLVRLVDDLLDVSRITRGKLELRRSLVQLSDVIDSAVEASQVFIDEGGHQFELSLPGEDVYLYADPNRLAQVLSNLLINAAKYTPRGGRIRLSAAREGETVTLSVSDSGVGIPTDMLERVFEMFTQVETTKTSSSGLGIGLTLVQSLVHLHGGTIEARSAGAGRGSEFRVRIPVSPAPAAVEPPSGNGRKPPARARRVLVVDDNRTAAEMLAMVLEGLGNQVRTANDGQAAVELAADYQPEIIFMDLGMPNVDGYEAARRIRRRPGGESMLLVALTGWGQDEHKQLTKQAGFDYHLVKPGEFEDLQKLFAKLDESES